MPEGPEVKIISDYLNLKLQNKFIHKIECISVAYTHKYSEIINRINTFMPLKYCNAFCRGKNTFIKLKDDTYFTYHLGMTGYWSTKKSKHAHLKITSDSVNIYFHDTRRFGNINIINDKLLNTKYNINLDFLNNSKPINQQIKYVLSLINTKREVCKVLLDQRYFLGVGNYLKSEILYRSKIHPETSWNKLNYTEMKLICKNTKESMQNSYFKGGAQIKDFKNPNSPSSLVLDIYNKIVTEDGLGVIKRKTTDNRISFWSPIIQKIKV